MTRNRYVSTAQVAIALGVGVSTVKRWADEEKIPAHRTPGGHRRILRDELLELIRQGRIHCSDTGPLLGEQESAPMPPAANEPLDNPTQALLEALQSGHAEMARRVILGAYDSGQSVEAIGDQLIAPVMHQVGHEWETERIDVYEEHRASQICLAVLQELRTRILPRKRVDGRLAIGGGPEGDMYEMSNLLVEMVLLSHGWRAVNLGPHTPLCSFEKAVDELKPGLLWLSVSHLADEGRFLREYQQLFQVSEQAGAAVAIGGPALTDVVRSQMPYTTFGDGLSHLASFVRRIEAP